MSDKMIVCCLKCIAVDTRYTAQSSEYIASCDRERLISYLKSYNHDSYDKSIVLT